MNMDDGQLIARFQRLTTELPIEKRLGQRRPELTDELYQTWLELDQRRLKETPEYRNVMLRADRHAFWLAELVKLSSRPDAAPSHTSNGPVDVNQTFRSRRQRAHPANMTRLERMIRFRARWRTLDRPFPERAISVGALRLPDLRSLDARYKRMGRHAKESFRRFRP